MNQEIILLIEILAVFYYLLEGQNRASHPVELTLLKVQVLISSLYPKIFLILKNNDHPRVQDYMLALARKLR